MKSLECALDYSYWPKMDEKWPCGGEIVACVVEHPIYGPTYAALCQNDLARMSPGVVLWHG